jgi:putative urate catabolism protein|tara:strand:+ start:1436 stop:2371 length:936 start_codon:yes stop_codon:yes gene_type:complete
MTQPLPAPLPATGQRDFVGYGAKPPHPQWPGGARLALQFVINYEEGGENCILDGDQASESLLSEVVGAAPWPGQRNLIVESLYEFGARAGFWRLHRLFTQRQIPVTVYGVTAALVRNPEAVAAMQAADWEIASHGLRWIDYKDFSEAEERADIAQALHLHEKATGSRPLGWYTGRVSAFTRKIIMEDGGFLYDSDSYADELPYWLAGPKGPHLVIPYTLDANDARFVSPQGFNSGDQFFSYLKDSFDLLYAEGQSAPKMLSIGLHCRISGRPGRAAALARFLDYAQGHAQVWIPRRIDIARHWHAHHKPSG